MQGVPRSHPSVRRGGHRRVPNYEDGSSAPAPVSHSDPHSFPNGSRSAICQAEARSRSPRPDGRPKSGSAPADDHLDGAVRTEVP